VVYKKYDATGCDQIYKVSSAGGAETVLTSNAYYNYSPQWSPDGNWVVYERDVPGPRQIYKVSSAGGVETALTSNAYYNYSPQWSPDGNWVVYYRWDWYATGYSQIYKVSSAGGAETVLTTNSGYPNFRPQWSPDGNRVVYSREDATGHQQIYKVSSETGIEENLMNDNSLAINIYPNPSTGKFIIEMENVKGQTEDGVIEIYNVLGEKIYFFNLTQQTSSKIDFSDSPKGIYFVKIYDGKEIFTGKIVIQ
ncbi:MAG: T9SS type A sorting domain-containing protein, partial [bacterium]